MLVATRTFAPPRLAVQAARDLPISQTALYGNGAVAVTVDDGYTYVINTFERHVIVMTPTQEICAIPLDGHLPQAIASFRDGFAVSLHHGSSPDRRSFFDIQFFRRLDGEFKKDHGWEILDHVSQLVTRPGTQEVWAFRKVYGNTVSVQAWDFEQKQGVTPAFPLPQRAYMYGAGFDPKPGSRSLWMLTCIGDAKHYEFRNWIISATSKEITHETVHRVDCEPGFYPSNLVVGPQRLYILAFEGRIAIHNKHDGSFVGYARVSPDSDVPYNLRGISAGALLPSGREIVISDNTRNILQFFAIHDA